MERIEKSLEHNLVLVTRNKKYFSQKSILAKLRILN